MRHHLSTGLLRLGERVLVGIALVVLAGYAALLALRLEPVTMLTGSMGSTIPAGSLVIDRSETASDLRVGDIITFRKPMGIAGLDTHRIVAMRRSGKATLVRTRGDANTVRDPWTIVLRPRDVVHREVAVVPYVGRVVEWFRLPLTRLLLIAAAAITFLAVVHRVLVLSRVATTTAAQ